MSNSQVVEASKKTVTVYADATDRSSPSPAFMMYGVRSIPAIVFTDETGTKIDTLSGRDMFLADNFIKKIDKVVKKFERKKRK